MLSSYQNFRKTVHTLTQIAMIPGQQEAIRKVKEYADTLFPNSASLPSAVFEQLSWYLDNTVYTSESNTRLAANTDWRLTEIKRGLSRWNCLNLLLSGNNEAYENFIQSQQGDILDRVSFDRLSGGIKNLSPQAQDALWATCFITKTNTANLLAHGSGLTASPDSEKFLTDTINHCPEIYPVFQVLSDDAKALLSYAFLENTHARHMLYTEGGNNMFHVLRHLIKNESITPEQYELWFARWIVNIAGFRGHEYEQGSHYLTQKTADDIFLLKSSLDQLWHNPEQDVFVDYLKKRAERLGLDNHLYLTHIGALTRLHEPKEGVELRSWFNSQSPQKQKELEESFEKFRTQLQTTPTYEPAVLDNLKSLGCSISESLNIYAFITRSASNAYFNAIEARTLFPNIPLCYRDIALKANLSLIVDLYRSDALHFENIHIKNDGVITYEKINVQLAFK